MTDEEKATLIEIRERLVRIETILATQDYRAIESMSKEALAKSKKNENEIESIKSSIKWVIVTVVGSIIAAIINILINYSWK